MKKYYTFLLFTLIGLPHIMLSQCYETVYLATADCPVAAYLAVENSYTYNYPNQFPSSTCYGMVYTAPSGPCALMSVIDGSYSTGCSFGYCHFVLRGTLVYQISGTPLAEPAIYTPFGPENAYMYCSTCF